MIELEMRPPGQQIEKSLRVHVLGRFLVEQGSRVIESENWKNGKARSLFKIMLSRRSYQISRQEASGLLWPELEQDRAANNLNQAVYSLRRTLEPELKRAGESVYLKTEGSKLQLNAELIEWLDLEEFKRLYLQAQLAADTELYEKAAELYRGDYVPEDLYEDWSVYRREALRQDWAELLVQLASLYQAQGENDKYQRCLHRVLESDFSHEWAVQRLMQDLAENGRREESLTFYHNFATKLQSRLNMDPLRETQQLYTDIVSGKISSKRMKDEGGRMNRKAEFTRLRQNEIKGENLPALIPQMMNGGSPFPSSFILHPSSLTGRVAEQQRWQEKLGLVQEERGGLTVLIGEAGIGKTQLAKALARQAEDNGFEVLFATCYPEQAELPYSTFGDLLEQALGQLDVSELQECLKHCSPGLYRLLPSLSYLAPSEVGPIIEPSSQGVFVGAAQALAWVGRRGPLLLVLEDIQHLPSPSLRLLRYLLGHPGLRQLVVLVTLRPVAVELASPELNRLLIWANEAGQTVERLSRFQLEEMSAFLAEQLGAPPGSGLLNLVHRVSKGNPRLALELVSDWRKEERLKFLEKEGCWEFLGGKWSGQLPNAALTYIRQVLSSLSSPAQVLLTLAALVGPTFSFEILRQVVLYRPDGAGWWIDLDKTKLGQSLIEITGAGLIEEYNTEYRFVYPLLAEALPAILPHSQRQCWKEVIGWARATPRT